MLERRWSALAQLLTRDRPELARLADVQASLRRVATLVARGAPPGEVFDAIAVEVGRWVPADAAALLRYEADGTFTVIGDWATFQRESPRVGTRYPLSSSLVAEKVFETERPARFDRAPGDVGGESVWRSGVGAPVIVGGQLWGTVRVATMGDRVFPADTEARVMEFTELLASAIANAESRQTLHRLAEQQAALRRVATLVARCEPPDRVLAVVAAEVARVVDVPMVSIACFEHDGTATERASFSRGRELFPSGTRWSLDGTNVVAQVRVTGRQARINDYAGVEGTIANAVRREGIRSTVGIPIVVAGRLWGAMVVSTDALEPLPEDTEDRLADFTDLVATAIANAESRAGLACLAEEQAALRRVATLVARAAPPEELFAAVADEVWHLLPAELASMARYETENAMTILAV
jgi:GAF domain-containing protein